MGVTKMAFFDELGKTISNTGKNVAKKAKDLAEVTSLNSQVSSDEEIINAGYRAIGKEYFAAHNGDESDPYAGQFKKILDAQAHIETLKSQIEQIKGTRTCPKCGADVTLGVLFCPSCGNKLEGKEAEVPPAPSAVCANCGAQLPEGTAFCPSCGTKVE